MGEFRKTKIAVKKICPTCNREFDIKTKKQRYCSPACSQEGERKVLRPNKEQLLQDIGSLPFVRIGKKYGVSDNSIRKWAKNYGTLK